MADEDNITLPEFDIDAIRSAGGCIIGSAVITDCVTKHPSAFFQGKFGFLLADPIEFRTPIPFKGKLGFFNVPDDFLRRLP